MVAVIAIVLSSIAFGYGVVRKLNIAKSGSIVECVNSVVVGLGIWSMLLFVAGHLHLLYKPFLITVTLLLAVPGCLIVKHMVPVARIRQLFGNIKKSSLFTRTGIVTAACIVIITLVNAYVPVTGGLRNDEICTHLTVPDDWLDHHAIVKLPYSTSYMAGNAHLHFVLASCFEKQAGPRCISWMYYLLCILGVYVLSRVFLQRTCATWAAIFAAVNPLIFRSAGVAFVDTASTLYVIMPLFCTLAFLKEKKTGWLLLAAFYLGIGAAVKPTNIVYGAVIGALLGAAIVTRKYSIATKWKQLLLVAATCFVTGAPWMVRNTVLAGFPVFPPPLALYESGKIKPIVKEGQSFSVEELHGYYEYCLSRYGDYRRSTLNMVKFPWDIVMEPDRFQIGQSVGTTVLSFVPLVFLFLPVAPEILLLLLFSGVSGMLLYLFILPEARYFMALFCVLSPVAAYAVVKLKKMKQTSVATGMVIAGNMLLSTMVAVKISYPEIRSVIDYSFRREFEKSNTPYFECFEFLKKSNISETFVCYPSRLFYYSDCRFTHDTAVVNNQKGPNGAFLVDVDYLQSNGRDSTLTDRQFLIEQPSSAINLIFESRDARVYQFIE